MYFAFWIDPEAALGHDRLQEVKQQIEEKMLARRAKLAPGTTRPEAQATQGAGDGILRRRTAQAPQLVCSRTSELQMVDYEVEVIVPGIQDRDPLEFWLSKLKHGPNELAEEALRSLSRICTSAGAERGFSKLKWLEGDRRTRLTDDHLRTLLLLQCNLPLVEEIALEPAMLHQWFD